MEGREEQPLLGSGGSPPRDRWHLVYFIMFMLGVGTLLPWNMFITAKEYFQFKLRNVSYDHCDEKHNGSAGYINANASCIAQLTPLQQTYENYLEVASMVPNVILMFVNAALTKVTPLRTRMIASLVVMVASFSVTVALVLVNTDTWQKQFFSVTLVVVVIINGAGSFVQGGLFGLSGMFPSRYTQSVMSGMGLGGIFASLANIFALLGGSAETTSAFGYFLSAAVVLAFCLVCYLFIYRLPYARYYMNPSKPVVAVNDYGGSKDDDSGLGDPLLQPPAETDDADLSVSGSQPSPGAAGVAGRLLAVMKRIWPDALAVFLVFAVTLSCFPAVCADVTSMYSTSNSPSLQKWANPYYTAVVCFLSFNFFDTLGRLLAGKFQPLSDASKALPGLALVRVAFVPLFMYCPTTTRNHLPVVFYHDAYFIVFMILFGLSNGYLSTLAMMKAPKLVSAEDTEQAGAIMSFFLTLGLAGGSALSFLTTALI